MGYDREANFGVGYSKMTEFLQWLSYKMYVLTGLQKPQRPLTLEQNRKPLLVIGDPGIGKTAGIIALREKIERELSAKPAKSNGEVLDARKMLADLFLKKVKFIP
ncbi:MAG: hypothetical protein LBM93_01400 [Oscillospiraceae bacterium]|jgi:midasin (ATPase involved in ribosome maturation)|nr:hypothetical protein [Oscillospiraceae bacterium]